MAAAPWFGLFWNKEPGLENSLKSIEPLQWVNNENYFSSAQLISKHLSYITKEITMVILKVHSDMYWFTHSIG